MTSSFKPLISTIVLLAMSIGSYAHAQTGGDVAAALRGIAVDRTVERDVTLADLGFTGATVLGAMDSRREIYWPVPAGIPIHDATIRIAGKYLRGDGGRTTLLVSVDGYPVAVRTPDQEQGPIDIELGVDGSGRSSGFMRLGLTWSSVIGDNLCVDERSIGNVAEIAAATRFSYRYDRDAIKNLATAWSALPRSPVVLVAHKKLPADAYDAAWRTSLALERAGKRPVIAALPSVGDTVERGDLKIPEALQALPAFRNLGGSGAYTLQNAAEIGALLLVRSKSIRADLVIADQALSREINTALDVLSQQIAPLGTEAAAAYEEWRSQSFDLSDSDPEGVRLLTLGGRQTIAIAPGAVGKTTELFQSPWKKLLAGSSSLSLRTLEAPHADSASISIAQLGSEGGSLDVLARADWTATFELGSLGLAGTIPSSLDLDLSAAPGASDSAPIASIFFNDYLLSARRLNANGAPERLSATIPPYALAARNAIRVTFQRQPSSDRCRETPQPFPAAVLPSSRIHFSKASNKGDFLSLVPAFVQDATVIVPSSFLENSVATLPMVSRIAAAVGVTPGHSTTLVSDGAATPKGPFLSIDVPVKGAETKLTIQGDRLVWKDKAEKPVLDVGGIRQIGVAELTSNGPHSGVLYRSVGTPVPMEGPSFRLARGDVAVIDEAGVVSEFVKSNPAASTIPDTPGSKLNWQEIKDDPWKLGAVASAALAFLFVLLLVRASAVRRRKN